MKLIIIFLFAMLTGACGTLGNRVLDPYLTSVDIPVPRTRVYGGVAWDIYRIRYEYHRNPFNMTIMLDSLDIPLSLAFDTLMLPITLYEQFFTGSLSEASEKGDLDAITTILGKGVDIDATDSWGHTALMSAAWSGHGPIVQLFIDKGAALNARTRFGLTPLHYAALRGHTEVVQTLLGKGADVNMKDNHMKWTPLVYASIAGHTRTLRALLDKGADADARDDFGGTALVYAACVGKKETIEVLIDNGADPKPSVGSPRTDSLHCCVRRLTDISKLWKYSRR